MQESITYLGQTNKRQPYRIFGIKERDRFAHLYTLGRTGTGKTTLIETLVTQDIRAGRGVCVLDAHGDLITRLASQVPEARKHDLIYLDAPNPSQPYGYNPLRHLSAEKIPLAASGLLSAFKKIWAREWGVRMEHVFRNALFALLEYGNATLPDILRLFADDDFRRMVAERITNTAVRTFWLDEFPAYAARYRTDAIAPIQNKIGAFLADPRLRRILTAPVIDLRLRDIMDRRKILLVNLAKGSLGEDSSSLLGALLVSMMNLAAFSRIDLPEYARRPFFVYLDEFQNWTTLAVANMISELRKMRLSLTLANQHLYQLDDDVRHAILGNVGTLVSFRVGPEDAAVLEREFSPEFTAADLVRLPNYSFYLKLMIDGAPSRPFSATSLSPGDREVLLESKRPTTA